MSQQPHGSPVFTCRTASQCWGRSVVTVTVNWTPSPSSWRQGQSREVSRCLLIYQSSKSILCSQVRWVGLHLRPDIFALCVLSDGAITGSSTTMVAVLVVLCTPSGGLSFTCALSCVLQVTWPPRATECAKELSYRLTQASTENSDMCPNRAQ